jgi:hypothetical protein
MFSFNRTPAIKEVVKTTCQTIFDAVENLELNIKEV